jgi:hypothetical protein
MRLELSKALIMALTGPPLNEFNLLLPFADVF